MTIEPTSLHRLKNQLAIVLGFSELMLEDTPDTDKRHADLLQIQAAAKAALAELPPMPAHALETALTPVTESETGPR